MGRPFNKGLSKPAPHTITFSAVIVAFSWQGPAKWYDSNWSGFKHNIPFECLFRKREALYTRHPLDEVSYIPMQLAHYDDSCCPLYFSAVIYSELAISPIQDFRFDTRIDVQVTIQA